ncbi:transmembrane protein 236 [Callorhinchus milii]|uniref:Transmembrane protein 236 n=1 Tax=Callorhinchus milii TaxID=7868 RepID=A0A4W3H3C5_CALMI|nr:transmembrane protein 236 [Callorhinchus milii]|eukprot:gi/632945256/ref/XP_007887950.1/ PREDICTED: transmembrane protein 236 [Callorhinchus milii]
MGWGKKIKFAVFEVLEFLALCIPTIVIAERLASILDKQRPYQVVLACSVAYVACAALFVWVPVKFLMFKKRILSNVKEWQPVLLLHLVLTTLPCFGFIIAGSQVQGTTEPHKNYFDIPISVVITSLILVSIIEKLCKWPLTGTLISNHVNVIFANGPVLTNIGGVSNVSGEMARSPEQIATAAGVVENGSVPPAEEITSRPQRESVTSSHPNAIMNDSSECKLPKSLKILAVKDCRAEIFVTAFMTWMDTIELLRVADVPAVNKTGWIYPIYIFGFISLLRIIINSENPLCDTLGVIAQDFPFIFIRISLIAVYGFVTPVLYLLKNIIVVTTYLYFNFLRKLRIFDHSQQDF